MSVAPASKTLAILGWSIMASAWRSASNRATTWRGVHAGLDDLQGDPAADGPVLLGHEDGAHAALADLLEQLVRADPAAGALGDRPGGRRRRGARQVGGIDRRVRSVAGVSAIGPGGPRPAWVAASVGLGAGYEGRHPGRGAEEAACPSWASSSSSTFSRSPVVAAARSR